MTMLENQTTTIRRVKMLAYHNKPELKQEVLAEMAMHRKADNLVKGQYWKDGKGCAVGCLIKSSNHAEYEDKFGIPEMLAGLEDVIFEGLPNEDAMQWPERFLGAINTGADLSLVGYKLMYWNLTENLVLKDSDDKNLQKVIVQCREAIKQCAEAIYPLTKGEKPDKEKLSAAESAVRSAESAAWLAAASAESEARQAAWSAVRSAESAAWLAAASAESEAWSAVRSAVRSAAWSAAWLAAASAESEARQAAWSAVRSAAWSVAYQRMADKLIELLEEARA